MKKNKTKNREQKRKSRRLDLNRETIRSLNGPELLEMAKGGTGSEIRCCRITSDTHQLHTEG